MRSVTKNLVSNKKISQAVLRKVVMRSKTRLLEKKN